MCISKSSWHSLYLLIILWNFLKRKLITDKMFEALAHFSHLRSSTKREAKEEIFGRIDFTLGSFFRYMNYLCSPKKWSKIECHQLIAKITHQINATYSKKLSYTWRLQVISSLLFPLHSFGEFVSVLPQNVV